MRKEHSGLVVTTLEIVRYEEKLGHDVAIHTPSDDVRIYGSDFVPDIESIHSQIHQSSFFNRIPKLMWMHGEPLSSVANGVSMRAIVDLAPRMEAFICMRKAEHAIWNSIKHTYYVPKGIDLERFHPIPNFPDDQRLSGEPAILYCENWRGLRNPLYLCVAMEKVWQKYPNARLHLYNLQDKKLYETFKALIDHNRWSTFIRSLQGPVDDINTLYNKADIVVSCLYPLYARGIEAFAAGKAFISSGYREYSDYPYHFDLHPDSMADSIINCWENYDKMNYRAWAKEHHNVESTVKQVIDIYERYL